MKISIYGSATGEMSASAHDAAKHIGALIAKRGHTLITGACGGIPLDAARAAHAEGGKVIGYSPARNLEEHKAFGMPVAEISQFIFVPASYEFVDHPGMCRKVRNISSSAACDACIIIAGQYGTLNEFTNAYDFGKPIGVLTGSGGIADLLPEITEKIRKEPRPPIVFSENPEELVEKLEECVTLSA